MFCQPGFEYFKNQLATAESNYLEIGVFNGDSIANLARIFPNIKVYAVDPFIEDGWTIHTTGVDFNQSMPVQRFNTYNNIKGLDNIKLFEMPSSEFAELLDSDLIDSLNVGHVLIDGSHHYADVVIDIDIAMQLIGNKSGSIVFDDVNLPDVARAYQYFLAKYADQCGPVQDIYDLHPGHILAHAINPRG